MLIALTNASRPQTATFLKIDDSTWWICV